MTDFPIIFSAPMVRALISGDKTATRRLAWRLRDVGDNHTSVATPWQRVQPGDRLWVREGWKPHSLYENMKPSDMPNTKVFYLADQKYEPSNVRGRPSIHMPRWASRLTLIINATKIEPLQAITEEDAAAEGIIEIQRSLTRHGRLNGYGAPGTSSEEASTARVNAFRALWRKLHGAESWDANPEVVALSFKVIAANIDKVAA